MVDICDPEELLLLLLLHLTLCWYRRSSPIQVLFLHKAKLKFFHFLEIVTGWLVPSAGQKISLAKNTFLQAAKGAENTKEKSGQCFMYLQSGASCLKALCSPENIVWVFSIKCTGPNSHGSKWFYFILFYFAKKSPKGHTVFSKGNILLQIHLFVNFLNRQIVTENLNFFLTRVWSSDSCLTCQNSAQIKKFVASR